MTLRIRANRDDFDTAIRAEALLRASRKRRARSAVSASSSRPGERTWGQTRAKFFLVSLPPPP